VIGKEREGDGAREKMSFNKSRGAGIGGGGGDELVLRGSVSKKWTFLLCLGSFCVGLLFTNRCAPCCCCCLLSTALSLLLHLFLRVFILGLVQSEFVSMIPTI